MPASLPVIPGARVMSSPFSSCWPSPLAMWSVSGLKAPALVPRGLATKPGAKGRSASVFAQGPPPGALVRTTGPAGVAGALPDHGVIWELALLAQIGGLLRTARGPPSKLSLKEVKGPWGLSVKGVVSCPVRGSALTLPSRRAGGLGVDEDPVLLARGGVATELLADVDVAAQRAFRQGRRFDRHRADSRSRRAVGPRRRAVLAGLRVGAGLQAGGGGGTE